MVSGLHFERQSGSLCGVHCLNHLLQSRVFDEFQLAELARELDSREREAMAEMGFESKDFLQFMGVWFCYSAVILTIGVLDYAGGFGKSFSLSLVPWGSSQLEQGAYEHPEQEDALICNHNHHWFTIRRVGMVWYNLNSLLPEPAIISPTYLALFLKQLSLEGHNVFVVRGPLHSACESVRDLR